MAQCFAWTTLQSGGQPCFLELHYLTSIYYVVRVYRWPACPSLAGPLFHLNLLCGKINRMVGEPQRQAEVVGGNTGISGLVVKNNATIRAFLSGAAAENERLSRDLRDLSSDLVARDSVPYRSIRAIWSALPAGVRPSVISLFFGIDFVFSSPKPREKVREP
ncbi:hypothetical protein AXF42_Ash012001 [Apostasia shenzhenica]|uniref:Uncharacterized protein n=1 Tax=Apostasia shenzhenica TaxID=1088818 RepID=A0A2I0AJH8_9ASPA|nr:hypothetical protein AXF42_Ash012001 [Apostasia shenzhenica]